MARKVTDEEYLEKLTLLFEKVSELSEKRVNKSEDEAEESLVYKELLNTLKQLQDDSDFIATLVYLEEQYIKDFYKELKSSPSFNNWAWEDWIDNINQIKCDLEGDFEFHEYNAEKSYKLNGSTLQATRIANRHRNLDFTLYNVGNIKISREKKSSSIQVEIRDIHSNIIAEWDEFKQTKIVGLIRLGAGHYRYEYRG